MKLDRTDQIVPLYHNELEPSEVGPRAVLSPELLAVVAQSFDLGETSEATDIGGTYSLNAKVSTARGEYVVRVHRPWVTPRRLLDVQGVRRVLAHARFPVAPPLADRWGETTGDFEGRLFEVEPFVAHDSTADSWDRYAVALGVLGGLHGLLGENFAKQTLLPPRVSNYGTPDLLLEWLQHVERLIEHDGAAITEARSICHRARELLEAIQQWWIETGRHLPRHYTHGDYGGGNVLFRKGHVVAVLDFDFLDFRERIFDVAYTLYWMLVRLARIEAPEEMPWHRVREMLDVYSSMKALPITRAEIEALPIQMARVPLYWVAEARYLPDPITTIHKLAASVQFSDWLFRHADELAQTFSRS